MAVLVVTGIGNKDTPRMESHFVRKFTVEVCGSRREEKSRSETKIRVAANSEGPFYILECLSAVDVSVSFEDRNLRVYKDSRPRKRNY